MSNVTTFEVTGDWRHIVDDGMVDLDAEPDEVRVTGKVTFTPVWPTVATAGVPAIAYTLGPVTALIANGVLTDLQGRPGVRLAAKIGDHKVRWTASTELRYQLQKLNYPKVDFELDSDVRLTGIIQQTSPGLKPIVLDPRVEALAGRLADVDGIITQAEDIVSAAEQSVVDAKTHADRAVGLAGAQDEHIAGTLEDPTSATHAAFKTVGNATYGHEVGKRLYGPVAGVHEPIDIWDEFRMDGTGDGSWPAMTYSAWTAGIDARLAGADAVKTRIGTDESGNAIWCWTAGPDAAPHALLVGGTHPIEMTSQHAAMRFFTEFVTSADPVMVALRSRLRLSWIPTLTPDGYAATRTAADGVNVNRNFGYFWSLYSGVVSGQPDNKGTAAMTKLQTQAVKGLLDSTAIACVIDCHMLDNTGAAMQWWPNSVWTMANQELVDAAAHRWNQTYNRGSVTWSVAPSRSAGPPLLANWAEYYLRFIKGRENAAAFTPEARIDIAGSVSVSRTTREAMRLYCGVIHTYLAEWLAATPVPVPQPRWQRANRAIQDATKPLREGGTLLTSYAWETITFDEFAGRQGVNKTFVDIPLPCPGWFEVDAIATFDFTANTYPRGVRLGVAHGPTPAAGGDVPVDVASAGYMPFTPPIGSTNGGGLGQVVSRGLYRYPAMPTNGEAMYRFQLMGSLVGGGAETLKLIRARMQIRFWPETGSLTSPVVQMPA